MHSRVKVKTVHSQNNSNKKISALGAILRLWLNLISMILQVPYAILIIFNKSQFFNSENALCLNKIFRTKFHFWHVYFIIHCI